MTQPCDLSLRESLEQIRKGNLSASEVTASCLARADEWNDSLNAFVTRTPELAKKAAREADDRRARKTDPGVLAGLPVALKDNLITQGVPTSCSSRILEGFLPPYDGTTVRKLRDAGGALVGKTNMDEFGMGSSCENSWFGATRNPWNTGRVPGGSSGGSAAAVASGLALAALGSDTGGSVRQPAAFCGLCGLRPTWGRVSRYGLVAYASSLDQIGPMAHEVADLALLMNLISGPDERDATASHEPVPDHLDRLEAGVKDLTLGVAAGTFSGGLDPEVERIVREGISSLESLGAKIMEVSLPHTEHALAAYYLIAMAEASSNLARYDGLRFGERVEAESLFGSYRATRARGFGHEVKRRIVLGTYALSRGARQETYQKAKRVRSLVCSDYQRVFEKVDAILGPTTPTVAFALGEKIADPLAMYLADVYNIPASLAGLPGLSVPCGFTQGGLPVGLQIVGRPFGEPTVLRIGRAYEREHDWVKRRPPCCRTKSDVGDR